MLSHRYQVIPLSHTLVANQFNLKIYTKGCVLYTCMVNIIERCGYLDANEISTTDLNEIRDFTQCVITASKNSDADGRDLTIGTISKGDRSPKPDRRGTTGMKVSQDEKRVVARDGKIYLQDVNNISSDPALGPRTEVKSENEISYPKAIGKSIEAAIQK